MSSTNEHMEELVLTAIGVIMAFGLLKANELYDFFERLDVFVRKGNTLLVHGPELVTMAGFIMSYLMFFMVTFYGIYKILTVHLRAQEQLATTILAHVVILLVLVQFFSVAVGCSHLRHKYDAAIQSNPSVVWDWR